MKILKCHCGEVEIQVDLKKEIDQLKRCNCSMCKRKGTMVTTVNKQDLKIIKGAKKIGINTIHFSSPDKLKAELNGKVDAILPIVKVPPPKKIISIPEAVFTGNDIMPEDAFVDPEVCSFDVEGPQPTSASNPMPPHRPTKICCQ